MAGGGGGQEGDPEFQIAPMIDVLLVLLIFFMSITSTQVLKVDKSIVLPVSPNAIKKDDQRAEAVVNVRWDEAARKPIYSMDDKVFPEDLTDLTKALAAAKAAGDAKGAGKTGPAFRVIIRGDHKSNAVSVNRVMNAAAEAGIADIAFSTTNRAE